VTGPLDDVRVLDLSTLVPGPIATLMLAEAGADVVKIERPGAGDEMRSYHPRVGTASANYELINRGKRAYAADLKDPADRAAVLALAATADVVVEQFRPGVADRLGLGYADVRALRPDVVYCSISGFGQDSRFRSVAGHDLTYLAHSGLMHTVAAPDEPGTPSLPPSVIADLAGGTYPAVVNILLALRDRDRGRGGAHLDIAMTDGLQTLAYGYIASAEGGDPWPRPAAELLTGGSPRYRFYRTADDRFLAVAPLEEKFWRRFCEIMVSVGAELAAADERDLIPELQRCFASRPAAHWQQMFDGEDVCVAVVATFAEAVAAGHLDRAHPRPIRLADGRTINGLKTSVVVGSGAAEPTEHVALRALPTDATRVWSTRPA
jgi:alpha-methylacyl-CoA racemase